MRGSIEAARYVHCELRPRPLASATNPSIDDPALRTALFTIHPLPPSIRARFRTEPSPRCYPPRSAAGAGGTDVARAWPITEVHTQNQPTQTKTKAHEKTNTHTHMHTHAHTRKTHTKHTHETHTNTHTQTNKQTNTHTQTHTHTHTAWVGG